jgi:hypothetical protein
LLDHILEHLDPADAFEVNAFRITALKMRSKHLTNLHDRCREAADRELAEATGHVRDFHIDPLLLLQERATWQRLRQYSLDRTEGLTLPDLRWLRAVFHHGRPGSRNFRRTAELLYFAAGFPSGVREDDPPSSLTESCGLNDGHADPSRNLVTCPP